MVPPGRLCASRHCPVIAFACGIRTRSRSGQVVRRWIAVPLVCSLVAAFVAGCSYIHGLLAWPILVVLSFSLRFPKQTRMLIGVLGIAAIVTYFWGFEPSGGASPSPVEWLRHASRSGGTSQNTLARPGILCWRHARQGLYFSRPRLLRHAMPYRDVRHLILRQGARSTAHVPCGGPAFDYFGGPDDLHRPPQTWCRRGRCQPLSVCGAALLGGRRNPDSDVGCRQASTQFYPGGTAGRAAGVDGFGRGTVRILRTDRGQPEGPHRPGLCRDNPRSGQCGGSQRIEPEGRADTCMA